MEPIPVPELQAHIENFRQVMAANVLFNHTASSNGISPIHALLPSRFFVFLPFPSPFPSLSITFLTLPPSVTCPHNFQYPVEWILSLDTLHNCCINDSLTSLLSEERVLVTVPNLLSNSVSIVSIFWETREVLWLTTRTWSDIASRSSLSLIISLLPVKEYGCPVSPEYMTKKELR